MATGGTKFEVILNAKLDKNSLGDIQKQINEALSKKEFNVKANTTQVKNATKDIRDLGKEAENSKKHTQNLGDVMQKFTTWSLGAAAINGVKNAMRDMVSQVFELDAQLVEFNKVTDMTEGELTSFTKQAYETAEAVARTGTEVIEAATNFSKAGYKEQAGELAEVALLYQNIADGEVSSANAAALVVSQMKSFNVEAKDAITIIDQINEVSNNFAVSSSDLATAIPKVSATLSQAGNTMAQTTALITAGTEIMTGQSSRVARG